MAAAAAAETPAVSVDPVECLATEENAALYAEVEPEVGGSSARLYFRRLNPEGAFYSVDMNPSVGGFYWTTFPRPEDREQPQLTDDWWRELQDRDWLRSRQCAEVDPRELRACWAAWLADQEYEAAEYYVAVYDPQEGLVARSETFLVPVLRPPAEGEGDDGEMPAAVCDVPLLDAAEAGWAANLSVGETTEDQRGEAVFHWLCWGVVARVDWKGVPREDGVCQRCVVGEHPASSDPASTFRLAGGEPRSCWSPAPGAAAEVRDSLR